MENQEHWQLSCKLYRQLHMNLHGVKPIPRAWHLLASKQDFTFIYSKLHCFDPYFSM